MSAVDLENVTKVFGDHTAVDDLSLSVPAGSVYGFIGPNGSGKTTTLRMIMNIFYPDRGKIRVFGEESRIELADRIGYLPEERGLYKKMKVRALLRFLGALKSGGDVSAEVDRWLEKLDLTEWANKKVQTLSKGMSQKVQFIAAVVSRPEMLILDEPFSGLDPVNADAIEQAVLQLRDQGTTILFSTHDMATAENLCDSIFMIFKGRKVLDGSLAEVQDEYGTDTIRVQVEGPTEVLQGLPGVERVTDRGQLKELRITGDCDSQEVLRALAERARVKRFELSKPSLHDIFVRIAGPEAAENGHDQDA